LGLSRNQWSLLFGGLPQGEMGMLIAAYLFSRGLLGPSQFNVAITVVVLITILATILMKIAHANPPPAPKV
jgi:hypothetical protein